MNWFYRVAFVNTLVCLLCLACDDGPTKPATDRIAPDAVASLDVEAVSPTTVRLSWTATGDNGSNGRAAYYDIRCATSPIIDSASWMVATMCDGEPAPLMPGESEVFVYTSLLPENQYFFCIRVGDEAGNWSGLSNVDSAQLMPLYAEPIRVETYNGCDQFSVADIDRDGDSDVVKYDFWEGIGILLNDGSGHLEPQPEIISDRKMGAGDVGDLDGDGDLDMATISYNLDSVFIYKQAAPGIMVADTAWHVFDGPHDIEIGDFNRDNYNDLAVITGTGELLTYLNTGNDRFMLIDVDMTGISPYKVVAGDVDGDGDLDLLVNNYYGASVSVFYNGGLGTFVGSQQLPVGQNPEGMVVSDLSGDLVLDVAVTNRFTQMVTILYGHDGYSFMYVDSANATGMCRALASGDLDGDGDNDLALANETVYGVTLLLNLGGYSGFAAPKQLEEENWCFDVAIVDMDGDSDLDIVTGHQTISVYLNNTVMSDAVSPGAIAQR